MAIPTEPAWFSIKIFLAGILTKNWIMILADSYFNQACVLVSYLNLQSAVSRWHTVGSLLTCRGHTELWCFCPCDRFWQPCIARFQNNYTFQASWHSAIQALKLKQYLLFSYLANVQITNTFDMPYKRLYWITTRLNRQDYDESNTVWKQHVLWKNMFLIDLVELVDGNILRFDSSPITPNPQIPKSQYPNIPISQFSNIKISQYPYIPIS